VSSPYRDRLDRAPELDVIAFERAMRQARTWRSVHAVLGIVSVVAMVVLPLARARALDHPLSASLATEADTANEFWFPRTRVLTVGLKVCSPWVHECVFDGPCNY
jgi:hypothetical protein